MMENINTISPEILAAAVGAVIAFALTVLWQLYIEGRNKVQLTYSNKVEIPLNIARQELKEKLEIFYNGKEIKDIYYAKLTITNTGRKTIRNQIFSCSFNDQSKSIDAKFPLLTTTPDSEVPVKAVAQEEPALSKPYVYRYKIEAIAPKQSVQIDFLRDGENQDFKVTFRPNEFDEVKITEGSTASDPSLELYIVQIALNYFVYTAILKFGNAFGFIGGSMVGTLLALPFLYNAFVAFRKLVPLALESNVFGNNKLSDYDVVIGNESQSGVVIGGGTINITPPKQKRSDRTKTDGKNKSSKNRKK